MQMTYNKRNEKIFTCRSIRMISYGRRTRVTFHIFATKPEARKPESHTLGKINTDREIKTYNMFFLKRHI